MTEGVAPDPSAEWGGEDDDAAGFDPDRDLDLGPSFEAEPEPEPAPGPSAEAPAPGIDPNIWRQTVRQLDALVSAVLTLPQEPDETLQPVADGLYPLVSYYARLAPSVASLWVSAVLSAVAYGSLKMARWRDAKREANLYGSEEEEGDARQSAHG